MRSQLICESYLLHSPKRELRLSVSAYMRVFTALIKKYACISGVGLYAKSVYVRVFTVLTKEGASFELTGARFVALAVLRAENARPGVVVADVP